LISKTKLIGKSLDAFKYVKVLVRCKIVKAPARLKRVKSNLGLKLFGYLLLCLCYIRLRFEHLLEEWFIR